MLQVFVRDGDLAIRRMRDAPGDYQLLAQWLTDPAVLTYYDGRDNPSPLERVREDYGPLARGDSETTPCIAELDGAPIGYVQFYPVLDDERTEYGLPEMPGLFGMDIVIGETAYWDQGIGTRLIRMTLRYLFAEAGARRVVIDPQTWNTRAVHVWEKCGFRKLWLLPEHEWHEGSARDCWLMAADPPEGV